MRWVGQEQEETTPETPEEWRFEVWSLYDLKTPSYTRGPIAMTRSEADEEFRDIALSWYEGVVKRHRKVGEGWQEAPWGL